MQVATQEDRFDRVAEFRERLIRRLLHVFAREPSQDRLRLGRAQAVRRHVLDHLVVLPADQLPVDRFCQHRPEVRVGVGLADIRPVQPLLVDRLQPRQELESQEPTERKCHRALAVGIDVLAVDLHLGAVVDHALDHGRDLYLIAAAARRAGLPPVYPHMLRHFCGFALANRGYDLRLIQDYLGHRDPRHTVNYTLIAGSRFEGIWR